jgi:hypothetical protein
VRPNIEEEEMPMRSRLWMIAPIVVLLAAGMIAGCSGQGFGPAAPTPVPTKTLRPTFTHTPAEPTAAPPTATPEVPPTATPEPPTATPEVPPTDTPEPATPTPEAATLRVTSATANVRSGPGTGFSRVGRASAGQTYEVTGKNPAGDWWEIDFDGQTAWIYAQMATVTRPEIVAVAANLPQPPPTARPAAAAPRPAQPAPAQPAPAPAPTYPFAAGGASPYPNTNDYLTVRCRTTRDVGSGQGPAGILMVNGPVSGGPQSFGTVLNRANTGMDKNMQYMYNENCKVELRPFVAGSYTAFLVDGGGKQISDPITFTAGGDQREFILIWAPR